jgi:hypothetical protein
MAIGRAWLLKLNSIEMQISIEDEIFNHEERDRYNEASSLSNISAVDRQLGRSQHRKCPGFGLLHFRTILPL